MKVLTVKESDVEIQSPGLSQYSDFMTAKLRHAHTPRPSRILRTHTFLREIYRLCSAKQEQLAVEKILRQLEANLHNNEWTAVDNVLERVDVELVAPSVLLAVMALTVPAKRDLRQRAPFVHRSSNQLRSSLGEERAERLLARRR